MARFQLLAGTFNGERQHQVGEVIVTERDLAAEFPHKFKRLPNLPPGSPTAPVRSHPVSGPQPGPANAIPAPGGVPPVPAATQPELEPELQPPEALIKSDATAQTKRGEKPTTDEKAAPAPEKKVDATPAPKK